MKQTILIVDDNPSIIDVLSFRLKDEGYEVLTANNGKEGVKTAREHKPDLILLDVMMPEMDGTEAAQELKNYPETARIPIIFLTALISESDLVEKKMGNHPVCSKAIRFPDLSSLIKTSLGVK